MQHALIVVDNPVVATALEESLARIGFTSFSHARTSRDAETAAEKRPPALILVGETGEAGILAAVRRIHERHGTRVILVAEPFAARESLPAGASAGSPFLLSRLDRAVASAFEDADQDVHSVFA